MFFGLRMIQFEFPILLHFCVYALFGCAVGYTFLWIQAKEYHVLVAMEKNPENPKLNWAMETLISCVSLFIVVLSFFIP